MSFDSPFQPSANLSGGSHHGDWKTWYCLRCQEPLLIEAGDNQCTRCQLQFNPDDPATYSTEQVYSIWRYWFPGFLLAVISGVISYAICLQAGELGFALFFGVPVSVGALLGYGTRAGYALLVLLGLAAIATIVMVLIGGGLAGVFCGLTLSLLFLAPVGFGLVLGVTLRALLRCSRWDQRSFLPWFALLILPYAMQAVERTLPQRREIATVRTRLHVRATPEEAWKAIVFYEEVEHAPSWFLRLSLPKPLRSEGNKRRVGEVVKCYYDRGYLAKRISRVEPHRRLSFDVVEQKLHFERDVQLLDGGFEIQPHAGGSEITLITRYRRKLSPEWLWRPIETSVVRALHEHVLEGMRRSIEPDPPYQPARPSAKDRDLATVAPQTDLHLPASVAFHERRDNRLTKADGNRATRRSRLTGAVGR